MGSHEVVENVLTRMRDWYEEMLPRLRAEGLLLEFEGPDESVPNPSVFTTLSSAHRLGRLVVWGTGEAELSLADVRTGDVTEEHRSITTDAELTGATVALVAWVRDAA